MSTPQTWINEQTQKPAVGQQVVIAVMRKAQLVDDGNGTVKWEFVVRTEPIDLERDVVFWRPDEE